MKVLIIEETFALCFAYNTILLFLNTYLNNRKNYAFMLLVSLVFSIMNIVCLYINSNIIFFLLVCALFVSPALFVKQNYVRELCIIYSLVLLITGARTMIPLSNNVISIVLVVIIIFMLIGLIPILLKNNYIRSTTALISVPDGKKISALIDTGIITEKAPLVIVSFSSIEKLINIENLFEMESLSVDTVSCYGSMKSFVIPSLIVNVHGKKQIFYNVKIALSNNKLPWDALISAQGII